MTVAAVDRKIEIGSESDLPYEAIFAPRIDDYSLCSGTTIENLMRQFGLCIKPKDSGLFSLSFRNSEEAAVVRIGVGGESCNIDLLPASDGPVDFKRLKSEFAKALSDKILIVPTDHPDRPRLVHLGSVVIEDSNQNGR